MGQMSLADGETRFNPAPRLRWRRLVGPTIATAIGLVILISLGVWQLHRLAWKEALLAQIGARVYAQPQALPPEPAWASLSPTDYEYRHVKASGVFENDKEAFVFDSGGASGTVDEGPGYFVLTPLRLADGSHVIVDRGFVPMGMKDPAMRASGQISGETEVVGLMRSPEDRNWFTPPDEPNKDEWFTRDPEGIAKHFKLTRPAPFTIDADRIKAPLGFPAGGATALNIPNNHFSYAITWFGLAGGLLGVFIAFGWRRLHGE